MTLERDELGGRTTYYRHDRSHTSISDSSFRLASSAPGGLDEHPRYLAAHFGTFRPPKDMPAFQGVDQAPRGSKIAFRRDGIERIDCLSRLRRDGRYSSPAESASGLGRALEQSLTDCIDGGDTAVMLSGGLDSGPIAAVGARIARNRSSRLFAVSWRLSAFPEADETEWVRETARSAGMELVLFDADHLLPFSKLDIGQAADDFPTFNAFRRTILETYSLARQHGAKTILNGAAGDRIYPDPNSILWREIRQSDFRAIAKSLARIIGAQGLSRLHRSGELRYLAARLIPFRLRKKGESRPWLQPDVARACTELEHGSLDEYLTHLSSIGCPTARENRFSRDRGLDRRDPFAHPAVVSTMLRTPAAHTIHERSTKWPMREAMQGILPESVRTKPRTGLLHSFFDAGYRANRDAIRELVMDERSTWNAWVRPDYVEDALAEKLEGTKPRLVVNACVGYTLWKMRLREKASTSNAV